MSGNSPRRQTQKRKYDNSHHSGHDDQPQLKRNREQPMDISPDKWVKVGLSETQSALLKSQKETRDYIMKKFNAIGLQAEIQIDYQENVMVGAFSDTDLVLADLTVRTSVADCIVPLNINSDVLKLQGWRDLCTTLLCEHQGLLLLSALPEKGLITGTSNIISSVVGQIKHFIRQNSAPKRVTDSCKSFLGNATDVKAFQKAERQYQRRITNPKAADEDSDGYTRDTRKMQRVRDYELPSHWAKHKLDETVKLVRLVRGSEEFMRVEGRFMKTAGSFPPEVECIERVQNPTLYRQYAVKRNHMDKQNKSSNNERILWHGTSDGSIQSINFDGFNRGYSGKNATVYGEGVYFAVRASYSLIDTYSPPDAHGRRYVYQCRVLVGHSTAGKFGMKVPPPRDGPIKYDSLADDPEHPSMYVILNDTQAYPEYLITLKKQKT
ncbi:hypothetical protein BaRGS_00015687 [Batillaria attramentaria]|uniref:Poly [ADP-ribose] polymerase n=1 Tax=Batillaria attramentaria TaxID=370345 RepID=A0ABD0L114_9CAEN